MNEKLKQTSLHPNQFSWTFNFLINRQQKLSTNLNTSSFISYNINRKPTGLRHLPCSVLNISDLDQLAPSNNNMLLYKYADDLLFLKKQAQNQLPTMQQEMTTLYQWCNNNHLIFNKSKTKKLILSNTKDNPSP